MLEAHYETWPTDVSDPGSFAQASSELRSSALRTSQYITDHDLGDQLASLYTDYVESMDAYTTFLATIGAIKQDASHQLAQDHVETGLNAGYRGAATYGLAQQIDASNGEAALLALAAGGISYLWEAHGRAQERERAEQEAVARAAREVDDKIQKALSRAQSVARGMTSTFKWQQHEAGFALSEEQSEAVQRMLEGADLEGLLRTAERQVRRRPRDPIVRNTRNTYLAMLNEHDAEVLVRCARDSYDAASLIPPASFYDEYRLQCVALAAYLAQAARFAETQAGVSPRGSTACSRYSVLLWRAVAEIMPNDASGEVQAELAWALMADDRLPDALELANGVPKDLKRSSPYAYQYACLMSRIGNLEASLDWLEYAVGLGMWDMALVKTDRDLESLRTGNQKGFEELITPQWEWSITNDWVWDDITVTNKSPFPLTAITIQVELVKDGKKTSVPLTTEYLGPGASTTWTDIVDGPPGTWDSATATLSCDQNR